MAGYSAIAACAPAKAPCYIPLFADDQLCYSGSEAVFPAKAPCCIPPSAGDHYCYSEVAVSFPVQAPCSIPFFAFPLNSCFVANAQMPVDELLCSDDPLTAPYHRCVFAPDQV